LREALEKAKMLGRWDLAEARERQKKAHPVLDFISRNLQDAALERLTA